MCSTIPVGFAAVPAEWVRERDELIEQCAKACEAVYRDGDWSDGVMVAQMCAAAVRTIKAKG